MDGSGNSTSNSASNQAADVNVLNYRRGQIKARLTRFKTFLSKVSRETNPLEIASRLKSIESSLMQEFLEVQNKIEELQNFQIQNEERESFEDNYFKTLAEASTLLATYYNNSQASQASEVRPEVQVQNRVRLPQINLPEFFGHYTQWNNFKDGFNSLINSSPNMENIDKFYYLKSCLKGEAAQVIQSIEVTNANYVIAWDMLSERYENRKLIVNSHVKGIFELNTIKSESHSQLRKLLDNFNKNIRALKSLGEKTDDWDTLLVYTLLSKLDPTTKRQFEESFNKKDYPKLKELTSFIDKRCQVLETLDSSSGNVKFKTNEPKSFSHVSANKISCAFCNGDHFNYTCEKFAKMSLEERFAEVNKNRLCSRCLRGNHLNRDCKSNVICKHCKAQGQPGRHNSLLHNVKKHETAIANSVAKAGAGSGAVTRNAGLSANCADGAVVAQVSQGCQTAGESSREEIVSTVMTTCTSTQVILATAKVLIKNSKGELIECRALLDGGSMSNFITKSLVQKLNLGTCRVNIPIAGVNGNLSTVLHKTTTVIYSRDEQYKAEEAFLVINKITENMPQISFKATEVQVPKNVKLADEKFNLSSPVDLLLGASVFFNALGPGQIKLGNSKLVLQETQLGWVITGPLQMPTGVSIVCNFCVSSDKTSDYEALEKFWKLEEISEPICKMSSEELECEAHYLRTYKQTREGRFIVQLPFKDNRVKLGASENSAIKQFYKLEGRFNRNAVLKQKYVSFMREYATLGHMTEIDRQGDNSKVRNYLPHHGVERQESESTKYRVVFNASSRTDSGLSLNDILKVGPQLQADLFSIVINFRKHNVVVTADIEKMYRQILISEEERDYQRIVWRENSSDELKHYRLNTLTYGTGPASFLAVRSLFQAANNYEHIYPEAARVIKREFYMDDLITGSESAETAILLKNQIVEILGSACLPLRKWCSNNKEFLNTCKNTGINESEHFIISDDKCHKALGLLWKPNEDYLSYIVNLDDSQRITKRFILSSVSKIFDPLGLINPVTVCAKLIMQRIWQQHLDWDDEVSSDVYVAWKQFYENLSYLNNFNIPRQVTVSNYVSVQLHGFSDSSEMAYGACVYVRSKMVDGTWVNKLLCAKSRVAPLKTISLPRLELCGAVLLVQLVRKVEQALDIKFEGRYLWCENSIVLSWILSEPSILKTFVANRVSIIQQNTDKGEWHHINSRLNPADVLSRGCGAHRLINNTLWWYGPPFLAMNSDSWPDPSFKLVEVPEKKKVRQIVFATYLNLDFIGRFSSFFKLQKVTAFILRFVNNCKGPTKRTGDLNIDEINGALELLVKFVQHSSFSRDIDELKKSGEVSKTSRLASLHPFVDEGSLLRVGGRIRNSLQPYSQKHPLILPSDNKFTKMLIEYEHIRLMHAGAQTVLNSLRNKYWPLHGKNLVKVVIHNCVKCYKTKPINIFPRMGDLPASRLRPARPFTTVGIDFAGPILIKNSILRNKKFIKSYICIFVCFVTKAVHIELTVNMTTEAFLDALKRFCARRGLSKDIYSDNGLNFVGANNDLNDFIKWVNNSVKEPEVRNYFLKNEISWHFIPPRSPHFGGLWEAAVKSAKGHLMRVVGNAHLTYEQLYTVLCQIEGILNSRPLTPMSEDVNDLSALTANHFLIGESLVALPEKYPDDVPENRLTLYERLQTIVKHFWKRWSTEYLQSVQQRSKWKSDAVDKLRVGSLVILKEDNLPVLQWRLGRVIDLHPGQDGVNRVVSVKTSTGVVKRSITKVCRLPVNDMV